MARKERVTRVLDGATFKTGSRTRPVRLADVDISAKAKKRAAQAKGALERMIKGKEVVIDTKSRDSHSRSVANVKVGGKSVNKAMKRFQK